MRQIFNKISFFLLLFVASSLLSCEDKNYYDPDRENNNPLQDLAVPSGFTWETTRSVSVEIEPNDTYNGTYNYLIEIFDRNPVIDSEAKLISNGVAKEGHPFTTQIAVPMNLEYVFVRQTAPTRLAGVRCLNVTTGSINSDFAAVNSRSTRSMGATRAATVEKPTLTGDLFPTAAPAGAEVVTGAWQGAGTEAAPKHYVVNSTTPSMTQIGGYANIYVTEDAVVSGYSARKGHTIYILPGKKLEIKADFSYSTENGPITIAEGAELIVQGNLGIGHSTGIYNKGTVTIGNTYNSGSNSFIYNIGEDSRLTLQNINLSTNAKLYNEGTVTISGTYKAVGTTLGYNEGTLNAQTFHNEATFINDNLLNCEKGIFTGTSSTTNNGEVVINDVTEFRAPDTWINNGAWTTNTMTTIATAARYYNNCKLIVNEKLTLRQATFINNGGSYVYTPELEMTNSRVELGAFAFFHVDGEAKFYEHKLNQNEGFYGTGGTLYALLKMTKAVHGNNSPNMIHYMGSLEVVCEDHPEQKIGTSVRWSMDANVIWAGSANNSVEIPKSECNAGSIINPGPPEDQEPEPIVDPFSYSYLFEDLWPFYGDYDMNDVVILVNRFTKNPNDDGLITSFSFDFSIKAVGAGNSLGGALMLDGINAASIASVSYSSHAPAGFETLSSGLESGQDLAVIPLYKSAHEFLGRVAGQFVNTVKGSMSNVDDPVTVTVTVNFASPMADNFDATAFNMFIIPDSDRGTTSAATRKEIHVIGYSPSKRANTSLFGNNNDASSSALYYVSRENLAWGIIIPEEFRWPVEYMNIKKAYTGFAGWVQSGGKENIDWWLTPADDDSVF